MRKLFAILFVHGVLCLSLHAQDTLTLSRYLETISNTHPLLRAAQLELEVADAEILQAQSSFDLFLKGKGEWKQSEGKTKVQFLDAGVEYPLATMLGPKLSTNIRSGDGTLINPENSTSGVAELGLGLSLQLWQGVQTDSRRTSLEKSNLRPELARITIEQERNALLRLAATRYWDWAESAEQLRTMREVVGLAEIRFKQMVARAKAGEIPPIDTIEALQELERRRGDMFRSERQAEQASIAAQALLWNNGTPSLMQSTVQFQSSVPMSLPQREGLTDSQRELDRQLALRRRPEARRIEVQQQSSNLDLRLAQEMSRPFIEAQSQYILGTQSTDPTSTWKLGLNFSHPLLVRSATAQEQLASLSLQRLQFQQLNATRQIQADINDALSALAKAEERIAAAEREVQASNSLHQAELKRFTAGESSLLFVNIRERALAEARIRLISARADHFRAMALYRWATLSW